MENKFELYRSSNGWYSSKRDSVLSDTLLLLDTLLNSEIGEHPEWIKKWLHTAEEYDDINMNALFLEKKGKIIELSHQFIDNLNKLVIPIDKLLELIDQWIALVKEKAKVIIIGERDGEYFIESASEK